MIGWCSFIPGNTRYGFFQTIVFKGNNRFAGFVYKPHFTSFVIGFYGNLGKGIYVEKKKKRIRWFFMVFVYIKYNYLSKKSTQSYTICHGCKIQSPPNHDNTNSRKLPG